MRPLRSVIGLLGACLVLAAASCGGSPDTAPRAQVSLNGTWSFFPDGGDREYPVPVPSFWDAPQDYDFPQEWLHLRHGVYRRFFEVPESFRNGRILLRIGRLGVIGKVRVNGRPVGGENSLGYLMMQLPYELDVTDLVTFDGPNELEVAVWGGQSIVHGRDRLDPEEQDFPPDVFDGGKLLLPYGVDHYDGRRGINGDVTLRRVPEVYVSDVHILPVLHGNSNPADDELELRVEVTNAGDRARRVTVSARAVSLAGRPGKTLPEQTVTLAAGERSLVGWRDVTWVDAAYWWPHDPQLYRMEIELREEGNLLDFTAERFGMREFRVVGNHFELNGVRVNLRGDAFEFSWHEGYRHGPATGPIISTKELVPAMQRRLLEEYRALNMNVLRPHKASGIDELYDWCDELGMLVLDEAPFWEVFQRTDERARPYYEEWVRRWVRERKNHPSIVMWIVGNECWGSRIPEFNYQVVRELDPTRPVFHEGIRPGDFEGDVQCLHYTGGYPMGPFNTTRLYEIYETNPEKPRSEGEAVFADGWPLKDPAGNLTDRRSERGQWDHPDMLTQAEWVRGSARVFRAMRYAGLPDARLYADWWYCFEPIEENIRPKWPDPTAPGIKPSVLHRPIVNVFDPRFPEVRRNPAWEYWRNSFAPLAAFDLEHDRLDVIGREPAVFEPGARLRRRLVVYNDTLAGGEELELGWRLQVASAAGEERVSLGEGMLPVTVPYGEKREVVLEAELPSEPRPEGWLVLTLEVLRGGEVAFSEDNRLGAYRRVPAPRLAVTPEEVDLGSLDAERAGQWRKLYLVNRGGGRSLLWTAEVSHPGIELNLREGNLRGEQEVYYRLRPEAFREGERFAGEIRFATREAGSVAVRIRGAWAASAEEGEE
ncbi:MAG: RICIN domain-containing protein [Acidobacteriota bacterium]